MKMRDALEIIKRKTRTNMKVTCTPIRAAENEFFDALEISKTHERLKQGAIDGNLEFFYSSIRCPKCKRFRRIHVVNGRCEECQK